jgi:hypothetical protein
MSRAANKMIAKRFVLAIAVGVAIVAALVLNPAIA